MTSYRSTTRGLVVLAVVVAVITGGCAIQPNDNTLPGQVAVGDDGYSVTVVFDQVENLVPNSQVLKDNVVIGTVASISVEDWQARVELRLLKSVPLARTSVFAIGQKTLLGAQYVEITTPDAAAPSTSLSAGALQDNDVVPVQQTGAYPATEQVLGAVALLLNNGGLSQISTITGELSTALRGRTPDARDLVRRANELLAVLDDNRDAIITALESINRLTAGLASDRTRIAQAIDKIAPGLRTLEAERDNLVRAVTATGRTGTRAVTLIQTSQRALLANLDALEPILANLGRVSEQLPEALKIAITIPFPAMTTEDTLVGDYSNLFATLDLRGSSLADSFLGLELPALRADDPITGPLDLPTEQGSKDDKSGDATDAGSSQAGPPDDDACLLKTLGVC